MAQKRVMPFHSPIKIRDCCCKGCLRGATETIQISSCFIWPNYEKQSEERRVNSNI